MPLWYYYCLAVFFISYAVESDDKGDSNHLLPLSTPPPPSPRWPDNAIRISVDAGKDFKWPHATRCRSLAWYKHRSGASVTSIGEAAEALKPPFTAASLGPERLDYLAAYDNGSFFVHKRNHHANITFQGSPDNGLLILGNVRRADAGYYTALCRSADGGDKDDSTTPHVVQHVELAVLVVPSTMFQLHPVVLSSEWKHLATCSAVGGYPKPQVDWVFDHEHKINESTQQHRDGSVTLVSRLIGRPTADKINAFLMCSVRHNRVTINNDFARLTNIQYISSRVTINYHSLNPYKLVCNCRGNPPPRYSWTVNDDEAAVVSRTETVSWFLGGFLYKCEACNAVGCAQSYFYYSRGELVAICLALLLSCFLAVACLLARKYKSVPAASDDEDDDKLKKA